MLFNVPQFIDIEDKIVGPLTAKQLGWLALGGVILFILWNFLDTQAFIIAAVIVGTISGLFAFYRPYNQSLVTFIGFSIMFLMRPKMYAWKRLHEAMKKIREKSHYEEKKALGERKKIDAMKIEEITKRLDQNH
jgi:membrane protein implicated in regulation of membrane protease activity